MNVINLEAALERFDGDREIYIDLVDTFLEIGPSDIEHIGQALRGGDMKQVLYLAHKMKGASITIGAEGFSGEVAEIEAALRNDMATDVRARVEALPSSYERTVKALSQLKEELQKQP